MNLAIWLERTALKHPKREALFWVLNVLEHIEISGWLFVH